MTIDSLTASITIVILILCGLPMNSNGEELILVRDGVSDYQICVPESASARLAAAADSLRNYLLRISGADHPILHDSRPTGPRIVLESTNSPITGSTMLLLGSEGFHIHTADRNLYLTAETNRGIHNAVYTFLESYLDCRIHSTTFQVIPNSPTLSLPQINDRQVPALEFRLQDLRDKSYNARHKGSGGKAWIFIDEIKVL